MNVLFMIVFVVPFLAVFPVYGYVGSKLKKNYLLWGLLGWGVALSFIVVNAPLLYFFSAPTNGMLYWVSVNLFSPIFSLLVAAYIAYRKGLLSRNMSSR
jgi:hypothetical protein